MENHSDVLSAVKCNGLKLRRMGPSFQCDIDIVTAAVTSDGRALQYAAEALRADLRVVIPAVSQNGGALQFVSDKRLLRDRDVVGAAVVSKKGDGTALKYADVLLQDDIDIVLLAVRAHGVSLQYASERLRGDPVVVLAAMSCSHDHVVERERLRSLYPGEKSGHESGLDDDHVVVLASAMSTHHCEVRPSTILGAGLGVFATSRIPAGCVVTRYEGIDLSLVDYIKMVVEGDPRAHYVISVSNSNQIYPADISLCPPVACGHMVNDSQCVPDATYTTTTRNAFFDIPTRTIVASVDIEKDTEVFIAYGFPYWASRGYGEMYWGALGDVATMATARKMYDEVTRMGLCDASSLPPLPPPYAHAGERLNSKTQNAHAGAEGIVVRASDGVELTDSEVFLCAMAQFKRDPTILRLKPIHVRRLLLAVAGAGGQCV